MSFQHFISVDNVFNDFVIKVSNMQFSIHRHRQIQNGPFFTCSSIQLPIIQLRGNKWMIFSLACYCMKTRIKFGFGNTNTKYEIQQLYLKFNWVLSKFITDVSELSVNLFLVEKLIEPT